MAGYLSRLSRIGSYRQIARSLLPLIAALMLLAGCGEGNCNCYPMNLPVVHVPHVRSINGLNGSLLHAASYYDTGYVLGLATYATSDGTQHLLTSLDGNIYALTLPSGRASAVEGVTCGGAALSLTADGSWFACLATPEPQLGSTYGCADFCISKRIHVVTSTRANQPVFSGEQTISDEGKSFSSPTWRADGQALAALEFVDPDTPFDPTDANPLCKLALYARPTPDNLSLIPVLGLTVAGFPLRDALQVAWSPDGNTLAILTERQLLFVNAPAPDAILKATGTGQFTPGTLKILRKFALRNPARAIAWAPNSKVITVLSHDAGTNMDELTQFSLDASRPPATLFTLTTVTPDERTTYPYVGPFAYSIDGRMLIFAYGMREGRLAPDPAPSVYGNSPYRSGSSTAGILRVTPRPQICFCPYPPTGLYAYTLPTTGT